MLPVRALARAFALIGTSGVVIASAVVPASATTGPAFTGSSPANGSIVKPTGAATVTACFNEALGALSTLTLTGSGGSVLGTQSSASSGACPQGGLTFTPTSTLTDGSYTATYNVQDTSLPANSSSGSFVFKVDGTAPAAPSITSYTHPVTSANAAAVGVAGAAEASHAAAGGINADPITVTLTVHSPGGGTDVTKTTQTDGSGNYSFSNVDISALGDTSSLSYAVKATDSAGNTGSATTQSGVTKDTTAPSLVSSVPAANTAHKSTSTVALTFDEALDTSTSSASVANKNPTVLLADSTVFSNANKTMTLNMHNPLTEAGNPYTVSYTVKDALGNTRTGSFTFTIDDTAPGAPTNLVATDPINSLNQTGVVVSGDAETGSTDAITLSDGTHTVSASTTAVNGHFTSAPIDVSGGNLADGPITVSVTATDQALNSSSAGITAVTKDVVVPTTPTSVTITPNSINAAGVSTVTVSATVSSDTQTASISIDDSNNATPALSVEGVTPDGNHVVSHIFDVSSLSDGTLTASVVAFDQHGNPSVAGTGTATKDAGVPAAPSVTMSPKPVNAASTGVTVSGTAEKSSTVHVTLSDSANDTLTHDVTADSGTGAYTWTFSNLSSLIDGQITASVTAEDAAHNVSAPGTDSTTMDRAVPGAPVITSAPTYANAANATAYPVAGTAESGATVTVTFTDAHSPAHSLVRTTTADSDGNWSVAGNLTSPATFDEGTLHISATATDAVGNVSAATNLTRTKDTTPPSAPRVDAWTHPVNGSNVTTVSVAGTAGATENGAGIDVSIDDDNPATTAVASAGSADGTGAYSVGPMNVSSLDDGTLTFTVTATDIAGNASTTSTMKTAAKDTIDLVPVSHTPNTAATKTPATVTATYNEPLNPAASSITVADNTFSAAAGTTTYANGGRTIVFTPSSPLSDAGSDYHVTVVARDVAGDSPSDLTFSFTVDDVAPNAPVVQAVTNPVYSGNQHAAAISGTAEKNASVAASFTSGNQTVTQSTTADPSTGAWSIDGLDLSALADGAVGYSVTATDAAGNVSTATTGSITKDTVVNAPVISSLTNPVNAANQTAVGVSGTAEPDSALSIDLTGTSGKVTKTTTADDNGNWSVSNIDVTSLADGTISAVATATDVAGNVSQPSTAKTSTKDTVVNAPVVSSLTDPVNAANQTAVGVSGTAEPDSALSIDLTGTSGKVTKTTTADDNGNWSVSNIDVTSLADGTISAVATATDVAGNVSQPSTAKTASKDTVAPAKPAVGAITDPVNAADRTAIALSGTAETLSSVVVTVTDGTHSVMAPASADGNGNWSVSGVDVHTLSDGTISATAVATDAAGNSSAASEALTASKDTVAPAQPVVSTITDPVNAANQTAVAVSGTAEPGSTVSIDLTGTSGKVTKTTSADGSGNWSVSNIDVTSLADGTISAVATATDTAGNVSQPSATKTASKATGLPGTPRTLVITPGDGALTVSWAQPASDGGYAVRSYTVSVQPHTGGSTTTFTTPDATTLAHKFVGLTNGAVYDVSVVANNVAGPSATPATGSGKPKFAAGLTNKVSATHIVDGAKITLSGALTRSDHTGVAGATITVFRKLDGAAAVRYLTLTTGSTGLWSATFAPASNATYFATYAGGPSVFGATSGQVRTTVAPKVTISSPLNKSTSSAATTLRVTGAVAPDKAGRVVVLYYVTSTGKLVRLTSATLSSKSRYVLSIRLKRGTWHLRVLIAATTGNTAGGSSTLTVKRT